MKLLWQESGFKEREWVTELFEPVTEEHRKDGERRIVLDNCILIDSYLHCRPKDYYAKFRGKNAWLIHLSDESFEGGYEAYDHFRGVFRNYWSSIFNPRRVMQFPLGFTAGFTRQAPASLSQGRRYLWSFMGQAAKASRPEMLRALAPLDPKFLHITDGGHTLPMLGSGQYEEVLRQSIFVPSPMGNVNLECFRTYEALEAGAIPVLERRFTLDYYRRLLGPHPLPVFGNWNAAAQFMKRLRDDPAALDELRKRCMDWWSRYKETLGVRIREFLSREPEAKPARSVSVRYSLPGWQATELLRHHSLPAAWRRAAIQVQRVTRGEKMRRTKGA